MVEVEFVCEITQDATLANKSESCLLRELLYGDHKNSFNIVEHELLTMTPKIYFLE